MDNDPNLKQVLILVLILLGFNTLTVAFFGGYCLSLQHQIDEVSHGTQQH